MAIYTIIRPILHHVTKVNFPWISLLNVLIYEDYRARIRVGFENIQKLPYRAIIIVIVVVL